MTVLEAGRVLHKNPQALRIAFQKGELKEFGTAYRNTKNTGWCYIINEEQVLKHKRVNE